MTKIDEFRKLVDEAERTVFFGGASVMLCIK